MKQADNKEQNKLSKKAARKRKRTALIIGINRTEYWTTQAQFWQWFRERKIVKLHDHPLTGEFLRHDEETQIVLQNTVLNRAHPNHLNEALSARRFMRTK